MSTIATQPHNIQTSLNFFKPNEDGSAPSPAFIARPETFERVPDTQQVTIQDVSANIERYNLATHGFQFVTFPCEERDFTDPGRVEKVYYKEVDQLLKDM